MIFSHNLSPRMRGLFGFGLGLMTGFGGKDIFGVGIAAGAATVSGVVSASRAGAGSGKVRASPNLARVIPSLGIETASNTSSCGSSACR